MPAPSRKLKYVSAKIFDALVAVAIRQYHPRSFVLFAINWPASKKMEEIFMVRRISFSNFIGFV